MNINGVSKGVEILDTAGEDDFQGMFDMWTTFGEGFLLVFAIDDPESFDAIKQKHDRVIKSKVGTPCPMILVGNKKDLEKQRKVSSEEAQKLANQWGIEYIETSALNNINCKEPFEKIASAILKMHAPIPKSGTCCHIF